MGLRGLLAFLAVATATIVETPPAAAQPVGSAAIVRLLGARAQRVFGAPAAPGIGGLVRLSGGVGAPDLGLRELAPGLARLWGTPSNILSFADAHPDLRIELAPPLHLLLDRATALVNAPAANASGFLGKNVLIGIADTGIDLTHPDFRDASGGTRVAWLLDLSATPRGKYPDLEQQYGSTDQDGKLVAGAIWAKADIDAVFHSSGSTPDFPQDEIGHGTLVAACAAANDAQYPGVAPQAGLLVARITDPSGVVIGNDELLRGVAFLFDRADAMQQPVVVNLSIGTDFGPHDGTLAWEQVLASHVGPTQPGHALVAAAGNSGSIADVPIHQTIHVNRGEVARVPLWAKGAMQEGSVQIWVAIHSGADLKVGLDAPGGTWIAPVPSNESRGKVTGDFTAAIDNGSGPSGSPVPAQSHGAVIVWDGIWPAGIYAVTLSGAGTADLYLQGVGDVGNPGDVAFLDGVRESTINLPATHPAIIGVGCTVSKPSWRNVAGVKFGLQVPVLDTSGAELYAGAEARDPIDGEPCWFSSAGPTLTGVFKPEIMAPGAAIVGALSQQALTSGESIFTPECEALQGADGGNLNCEQIDALHGVSKGTSFSSPIVAGAAAILFEEDPTLTQDDILAALQSGAHPLRGAAPFEDQAGAGELDVAGALAALNSKRDPQLALPARSESWLTLGADAYLADGSTPLEAVIELRAARSGTAAPAPADGFGDGRLAAFTLVDGVAQDPPSLLRVAPGVWVATVRLPAGLGGRTLTVGATFDGADIATRKSVPIATDAWNAAYSPTAKGGCAVGGPARDGSLVLAAILGAILLRARARSSTASPALPWAPAGGQGSCAFRTKSRSSRGPAAASVEPARSRLHARAPRSWSPRVPKKTWKPWPKKSGRKVFERKASCAM